MKHAHAVLLYMLRVYDFLLMVRYYDRFGESTNNSQDQRNVLQEIDLSASLSCISMVYAVAKRKIDDIAALPSLFLNNENNNNNHNETEKLSKIKHVGGSDNLFRLCETLLRILLDGVTGWLVFSQVYFYSSNFDLSDSSFANTTGRILSVQYQGTVVKDTITWITDKHAPFGFKLNEELDTLFGAIAFIITDIWGNIILSLYALASSLYSPFLSHYSVYGLIFICGGSMLLAIAFDFICIIYANVGFLYRTFCLIHFTQVRLIWSLWKQMNGMKWNVLRIRLDHEKFDSYQILLGSMLLTTLLFLAPTILAYYILFLMYWVFVFAIQFTLWISIEMIHNTSLLNILISIFPTVLERPFGKFIKGVHYDFNSAGKLIKVEERIGLLDVLTKRLVDCNKNWESSTIKAQKIRLQRCFLCQPSSQWIMALLLGMQISSCPTI